MLRFVTTLLILFFHGIIAAQHLDIKDDFVPGFGKPVGSIALVRGQAGVIHAKSETAYKAKKGLPLYMADTIVTMKRSRVSLNLNDGSSLSLAPGTRITIDRNVYNPKSKDRSSFFSMSKGKARFRVKKLPFFRKKDFKVKTRTAVVGVRGSDFVVKAEEENTLVSTLEDTRLLLTMFRGCENVSDPAKGGCEVKHVELSDFQKASILKDSLTPAIDKLSATEIQQIKNEFPPVPPPGEVTGTGGVFFSKDSYARPEDNEVTQVEPVSDIDDDFSDIEDDITDEIGDPEADLPSYPYEP